MTEVAEVMSDAERGENASLATISDTHPQLLAMLESFVQEAQVVENSPTFVYDIMEAILNAESFDDIFAAQDAGGLSGKEFTQRPFYLRGEDITIRKSTIEGGDGLPFYAILTVTEIHTGEQHTLNCGGKTFMAVLYALRERGYFNDAPEEGRAFVLIGTDSEAGYTYLSLKPFQQAPARRGKK